MWLLTGSDRNPVLALPGCGRVARAGARIAPAYRGAATVCRGMLLCAGVVGIACSLPVEDVADLVFRNGAVYTVDEERSWARAVAVSGGRIVGVGSDADAERWIGPETRVIDLQGKMLLPAFGDSHVHPISAGLEFASCDLNDIVVFDELLAALRGCAQRVEEGEWIRGGGWFLYLFDDGNPHKSILDEIAPGHPVLLGSADGHSSWASSRALEIAGINAETPDPTNGRIERDPGTGEPTGTLREAASRLVARHMPEYGLQERIEGLRLAVRRANGFGITRWQDAGASRESLQVYRALRDAGELTVRAVVGLRVNVLEGLDNLPRLTSLRQDFGGERLSTNAVKIVSDGVIEAHTVPLLEPYTDRPGFYGEPFIDPQPMRELVAALDAEGFQVHVHAIGDAAIRMTLDAFEHAREVNGRRDSRHHIAHAQLIHPDDIPRFAELDVIANFQPLWSQRDGYIIDLTEPLIGMERSRWLYPIGSVVAAGGRIAFGSDWSVSSLNPLDGMQVAVTRRGPTAGPGEAWYPQERIDLATAIAGYTIGVAYLNFREQDTGSIEPGKLADLIVLEGNLFEIQPHEIHDTNVLLTLLEGGSVYEHTRWRW